MSDHVVSFIFSLTNNSLATAPKSSRQSCKPNIMNTLTSRTASVKCGIPRASTSPRNNQFNISSNVASGSQCSTSAPQGREQQPADDISSLMFWDNQDPYTIPEIQYKGVLAGDWSPCTGGLSIGKYLEDIDAPLSYRSLAFRWEQLNRPHLQSLRTPLDLLTGRRDSCNAGKRLKKDLSDIAEAQEAMIIKKLDFGLDNDEAYNSINLFVGFASHLDIYCAVNSELSGLEQNLNPEKHAGLYRETCHHFLKHLEQRRAVCARSQPHRCLGLLLWGEVYPWSLEEKHQRFEAYKNRTRERQFSHQSIDTPRSISPCPTFTSGHSSLTRDWIESSVQTPILSPSHSSTDFYADANLVFGLNTYPQCPHDNISGSKIPKSHSSSASEEWSDCAQSLELTRNLPALNRGINYSNSVSSLQDRDTSCYEAKQAQPQTFRNLPREASFPYPSQPFRNHYRESRKVPLSSQLSQVQLSDNEDNLGERRRLSRPRLDQVKSFSDWSHDHLDGRHIMRPQEDDFDLPTRPPQSGSYRAALVHGTFRTSPLRKKRALQVHAAHNRTYSHSWLDDECLDEDENTYRRCLVNFNRQRLLTEQYKAMLEEAVQKLDVATQILKAKTSKAHRYPRSYSNSSLACKGYER